MTDTLRRLGPLDRLLSVIDQGLRTSFAAPSAIGGTGRPTPRPADAPATGELEPEAGREAASLMRVNHAGEVAAQALYHGQALVARDPATREFLLNAAREEGDHLVWCAERLEALRSRPSLLNPLWYAGSAAIGALAGLAGDRISLGFITETERQVEGHIDEHLARLPAADTASRAILEQMKADEIRHGAHALERGGATLPEPLPALMRMTAKLMTRSAYWI
ncbi:MAG TPA: 2-polyprenyl-3-methyl-6-methoxy-1,4-benzoquinone monooxygenase [Steroidobacteraceae bacterium]|nr:2-polyprenyl-3-methyl-6-methoxy-1,4-benzoquinone monooxygenase [Steroidobacteraceae bacterium]